MRISHTEPTATIELRWHARSKRWVVSASSQGLATPVWAPARTEAGVDRDGLERLVHAITDEMESWLY